MYSKATKAVTDSSIVRTILLLFVFLVLLVGGLSVYKRALAQGTGALIGFAWSTTVGWISFNCADAGSCAGPAGSWGVISDPSSGILSGYAWSPNIGWVKFDPSQTSCPVSGGCVPQINLTTGQVSGFARACGGTLAGDCVDPTDNDNWDGWISLSSPNGTIHTSPSVGGSKGVTYISSTNKLIGFAWGGPAVVGWIKFNPNLGGVTVDFDKTCSLLGQPYAASASVHFCARSIAKTLGECGCIDAVCQADGLWSNPDVKNITPAWKLSCSLEVEIENDCDLYGNNPCALSGGRPPVACGETRKFYRNRTMPQNASSTATCDDNYNSLQRTCLNTSTTTVLTGDPEYVYTTCRVNPFTVER